MKNLIQYISAGFFCLIAFSCSNNFLKDGLDLSTATVGSELFISPEWGTADYDINVPSAGNAKFTVVKTPDWLKVNKMSGQFVNDHATINCSANLQNDYSAPGFYNASLVLNIESIGKVLVPVAYIAEGNPSIQTETNSNLQYDYSYGSVYVTLSIKNPGDGILLWGIAEKPDWITINFDNGPIAPDGILYPLPHNNNIVLNLYYNTASTPSRNLTGNIVIVSNDKNHSETTINIAFDMGNPSLYYYANLLDFGETGFSIGTSIENQGNGFLAWKIESLPEWLSVSDTCGILLPKDYSYNTLSFPTFTCNRNLLPSGQHTKTIYLKTNDKIYPSFPITVKATGK